MMKENWTIEFVNDRAAKEIFALTPDLKAKFLHISELLITFGPQNVGMPHIRPLKEKMWEIRLKGKDRVARSIYALFSNKRIVILHTFIKKTQETPDKAIHIAQKRLKEVRDD